MYEIDIKKTTAIYNQLLTNLLESELFSVNPYELSDAELDTLLTRRADNLSFSSYMGSWIERTEFFYSRCFLKDVIHHTGEFNWYEIRFQPEKNFGPISMSRFQYSGLVFLGGTHKISHPPIWKVNEVLGSQEETARLEYFIQRKGQTFIFCYHFPVIGRFGRNVCHRFAEKSYSREALLLTQLFILNYLINHPLDCFPSPRIDGGRCGVQNFEMMTSLLTPIIEEKRAEMEKKQYRIKEQVAMHSLSPEEF